MQKTYAVFFNNIKKKRLTSIAGSWVYFFIMALIPLTCMFFMAYRLFGLNIGDKIGENLPEEFQSFGLQVITTAGELTNGVTFFFGVSLIISGSNLFSRMRADGEFIFGAEQKKNSYMRRLFSIGALAVLFLLFLSSALVFAFHEYMIYYLKLKKGVTFTAIIATLVVLLGYFTIILFNLFICPIKLKKSCVLLGSLIALAIVIVDTLGFILYMRISKSFSVLYGALSGVIIFLIWTYILMFGLLTGINYNALTAKDK